MVALTGEEFNVTPPAIAQPTQDTGLVPKIRRAIDTRYLNLHGCVASTSDQGRIAQYASAHDLVWVLNSRTANIVQRWKWPRAHLDVDDVPSTYLRAVAGNSPTVRGRWKARLQQFLLRRREHLYSRRFTTLSVCSDEDRVYLGGTNSDFVHVIPNGFERPESLPFRNPSTPPRIGFIGLFSYPPNLDGMRWFLKECWPGIRQAVPGIRLRLIGKETDGALRPMDADVDALGWVKDPSAEISTWSAMIIPIRFGGGTRIKIAEAFSRKCPAVSTSLGAYGYDVADRKQLRLADNAHDFRQACVELVRDAKGASEIAERAWTDFLNKWTWEAIAPKVWAAAEDCLRRNSA